MLQTGLVNRCASHDSRPARSRTNGGPRGVSAALIVRECGEPSSAAAPQSSRREPIPRLVNTFRRCHSTVRGLRNSSAPTLMVRPALPGQSGDLGLLGGQIVARLGTVRAHAPRRPATPGGHARRTPPPPSHGKRRMRGGDAGARRCAGSPARSHSPYTRWTRTSESTSRVRASRSTASCHELQRVHRRLIQPLHVDQAYQRSLGGRLGQERQDGQARQEPNRRPVTQRVPVLRGESGSASPRCSTTAASRRRGVALRVSRASSRRRTSRSPSCNSSAHRWWIGWRAYPVHSRMRRASRSGRWPVRTASSS
jgi:hypothetical protein